MKILRKTLLTLLLIPLFAGMSAKAQNLIPNGGFENDLTSWWTNAAEGTTASFSIVSDDAKEGTKALKVEVITPGANPWDVQAINDAWASVTGNPYTLKFWAKATTAGSSFKTIMQVDGSYSERVFAVTETWQQYSWTFNAGANNLQLKFHFPTEGVFTLDGFEVFDEGGEPPLETELISNGGFENGTGNSFTGWWTASGGGGVATFTATTDVVEGARALKAEVITPGANPWDVQAVNDVPWASVTGESYTLTFWAKAAVAGSSFKAIMQRDPAYAENVITLTEEWAKYQWTFTAQADGLSLKFHFPNPGTFFIDSISVPGKAAPPIPPFDPSGLSPIAQGNPKFLGNVYSGSQIAFFANYWNQVTPENAGKWASVESTRDVMNWTELDAAYNFAKSNGFPFRFHVLVWGNQQPTWIESLPAAEQLEEIREWFAAVAERYPEIDYLEVVNEPLHDAPSGAGNGNYIEALGGSGATGWDWILNSFRIAKEFFPNTKLMLNEYSITNNTTDARRYIGIVDILKAENLIDVIGIQGHAFSTTVPASVTKSNLDLLASTGIPIMVTEMDIDGPTNQVHLEEYKRIFPIFWEHPSVIGITLWGWRPGLWRDAQGANLVMANGGEKPAMVWLKSYVSNKAPVVTSDQVFSVSELATVGTAVGTVIASDPDSATSLSGWQITGGLGQSLFSIDSAGNISVTGSLDYETTTSYALTVTVSDGFTTSSPAVITINVINENDNAPEVSIVSPADGHKINKGESLSVTAEALDADGNLKDVSLYLNGVLVRVESYSPYQWSGASDNLLKAMAPGNYSVVAVAADKGGKTASDTILVTVLDDIIGANCGTRNGTAIFEINPKYLKGATHINWWYNGYTKSIKPLNADKSKVEVSFGEWFNPGDLHVGINYKKAPYYVDLKKVLTICDTGNPTTPQVLTIYPNPTNGPLNITAGKIISEVTVFNSTGKKVAQFKKINSKELHTSLSNCLPNGIYKVVVNYSDRTSETKTLSYRN